MTEETQTALQDGVVVQRDGWWLVGAGCSQRLQARQRLGEELDAQRHLQTVHPAVTPLCWRRLGSQWLAWAMLGEQRHQKTRGVRSPAPGLQGGWCQRRELQGVEWEGGQGLLGLQVGLVGLARAQLAPLGQEQWDALTRALDLVWV